MATPNIVPRADQEGGLGTAAKSWGKLFIENASAGGTAAATISNLDVDQVALDINASNTSANVLDITAQSLSGGSAIMINGTDGQVDLTISSSADTGDIFTIATTTHGATTIKTVDDDAHAADLTMSIDGDLLIDNDGIGLTKITSDGVEIENAASSGASALLIDNDDVDAIALDIDADNTTVNVVDITSSSLTTGNAINVTATNSNFRAAGLKIDQDHDSTAAFNGANGMIHLDYDKATATGDGNTHLRTGSYINMSDAATNHANSTVTFIGSDAVLDAAATSGANSGIGYQANVQDFTTNIGYKSTTEDIDVMGGINADFISYSSQDSADYFKIRTTTSGATLLETVDGGGTAADLTFAPDGIIKHVGTSGESRFYNTYLNVSDYMSLVIGANGDAKFTTVDAAAAAAHFEIEADGNITLDAAGTIELEGATNVTGDLGVSAEATVASLICTAGATFGGGFGSTGATISTAGVGQFNGALTTDAALTADNIVCTNAATFGGGTGSTGVTISTTGTVTADGLISSTASGYTGTNYRTLWIDAGAMVPQVTNGAAAGTEEASSNDVMSDYFAFDASTIEYVQAKVIIPEQWNGGTVKAKFYWKPTSSTTTSHTCRWSIAGTAHADGGTIDSSFGTDVAVNDDVLGTAAGRVHISDATGDITIAGSPVAHADELVYFRIHRVANHANDDLNEDAHLLGVAIQYQEAATIDSGW
tara:strand:+ start:795 stop:2930 length:2136 start_codon:yes stop_codon:yes gene_type:complete